MPAGSESKRQAASQKTLTEFVMNASEMTKYREPPGELLSIRSEILECLVDGLQFLKSDAEIPAQRLANRILANIIIEHLDISGFAIHRKLSRRDGIAGEGGRHSAASNVVVL
jgi:hypothetical protein